MYFSGVKSGCSACPPGHYNDKPQESKCKPCEGDELTTTLYGQTICNVTIGEIIHDSETYSLKFVQI